jgi:hypothetical protein
MLESGAYCEHVCDGEAAYSGSGKNGGKAQRNNGDTGIIGHDMP